MTANTPDRSATTLSSRMGRGAKELACSIGSIAAGAVALICALIAVIGLGNAMSADGATAISSQLWAVIGILLGWISWQAALWCIRESQRQK